MRIPEPKQSCLHLNARSEEADTPEETSEGHADDDGDHGQADFIQEEVHVKADKDVLRNLHLAVVDAVDDHAVQLGDFKLEHVDHDESQYTQEQGGQVLQIVAVDVSAKYQDITSFLGDCGNTPEKAHISQFIHYITL